MNSILTEIQQIFSDTDYVSRAGQEEENTGMIEDDMNEFFTQFEVDNSQLRFCWSDEQNGEMTICARDSVDTEWESITVEFPHLRQWPIPVCKTIQ